jgi:hypothetical protein
MRARNVRATQAAVDRSSSFLQALAIGDSAAAARVIGRDHHLTEFGRNTKEVVGRRGVLQGRRSLQAVTGTPRVEIKRVLANRRVVLVQAILRGQAGTHPISSDIFYLGWDRDGELKRSIVYWGADVLVDPSLAGTDRRAPARPEVVNDTPTVKINKDLIKSLYASASLGLAARLAALDKRPELATIALQETTVEAGRRQMNAIRPYLSRLGKPTLSIDDLYQAGPYVIATMSGKGVFTGSLGGVASRNQTATFSILVVANMRDGKPRTFQTYTDLTDLKLQLGL